MWLIDVDQVLITTPKQVSFHCLSVLEDLVPSAMRDEKINSSSMTLKINSQ